jgi:hypothetical protein
MDLFQCSTPNSMQSHPDIITLLLTCRFSLRRSRAVQVPNHLHPQNHYQRGVRNVNSVAAPNHKKLVSRRVAPFSRLQLRFPSGQKTVRIEGLAQGFLDWTAVKQRRRVLARPMHNGRSGSENKKEKGRKP